MKQWIEVVKIGLLKLKFYYIHLVYNIIGITKMNKIVILFCMIFVSSKKE